jgi:hypothetical protein
MPILMIMFTSQHDPGTASHNQFFCIGQHQTKLKRAFRANKMLELMMRNQTNRLAHPVRRRSSVIAKDDLDHAKAMIEKTELMRPINAISEALLKSMSAGFLPNPR